MRLRGLAGALFVALLLGSTQLSVTVETSASLSGRQQLDAAEVAFALITALVGIRLFVFKDFLRLDRPGRYVVCATGALAATWVAITAGRYLLTLRWVLSITLVEYLVFAAAWYLAFRLGWLKPRAMLDGLLIFVTALNSYALYLMFVLHLRVRASGLLSNVNVYIGLALLVTPLLLQYGARQPRRGRLLLAIINAAVLMAFVLLSGSRFALIMFPMVVIFYFVVAHPRRGSQLLKDAGIVVLLAVAVAVGTLFSNPHIGADVDRAREVPRVSTSGTTSTPPTAAATTPAVASPSVSAPSAVAPGGTATHAPATTPATPANPVPTGAPQPTGSATPRPPDAGNPDWEPRYDPPANLTHGRILARTLAVLENDWIWGTGRPVIFFDGWGYHPPHNLFLEVLVYIGLIGSLPYFALALYIPVGALRKLGIRVMRSGYLIGLAGLLGYSCFQPLITDQLVLLLIVWGVFGALSGPGCTRWRQLVTP